MDDDQLWAPAPARSTRTEVDLGLPGLTDVREVARGGDSVVYRAHQAALHRDVAIKVLLETDPATIARFARELEITVRLGRQHPHIVTVLDTATTRQGHPCLVMDFYDLGSLHDRLRSHGPLPVAEVVAAGTAVADALRFAHRHGVLHRDVKPQNVLVLPTSYVLTDFGIARMADAGHTASLERFSYRHASPQVLDGLDPDPTDDVWSLGSTMSTLLDGRAPFAAPDPADDTALGYLRRVRTGQRRELARADVPDRLRALVERCLAHDREGRFATAEEVHAALLALPTETRSWSPGAAADPHTATPVRGTRAVPPPTWAAGPPARSYAPAGATGDPVAATPAPAPVSSAPPALPPLTLPPVQPEDDRSLAPSALSLLSASGAAPPPTTDDEDTGVHPEQAVPTAASPRTTAGSPRRRRPAWVPVAAFMGGAILLGSAVGVGVTVWANAQRRAALVAALPTPTAGAVDVPVHEGPLPTADGPLQAPVLDDTIAPQDLALVDGGTSLTLSWSDPTNGDVTFVVVDPDQVNEAGELGVALKVVDAGINEVTIEGVDPNAPTVCLTVLAIDLADADHKGMSPRECVTDRVAAGAG
ncbi:serine/threonine protein kinase [Cellulomonas flavigena DSM 20109]|uniref:non-specific serine/threonine protein kinase n=1 Tax=Cellulomonas flavigena (strain ATCC 482 / DSM 20109 / BCRC 11376 / JCM 18109 / NBRC 3775 / NCIMB 8073 / NRS 134) TaxID=446466 RepID=D5ULL4_CELFN|nr:serine/threonine-protein kinase [Cellulomonas flavigena]ADG74056.1 serine/threonine protein kinase [Cellulomonas flavigena DSM 20109]